MRKLDTIQNVRQLGYVLRAADKVGFAFSVRSKLSTRGKYAKQLLAEFDSKSEEERLEILRAAVAVATAFQPIGDNSVDIQVDE